MAMNDSWIWWMVRDKHSIELIIANRESGKKHCFYRKNLDFCNFSITAGKNLPDYLRV
jgi:hypothetical protein